MPAQVSVPAAELDAWEAGQRAPPAGAVPALADTHQPMRTVKLFSLNDYLGLSTHPAVCRAAADAALACGNGACRRSLLP